MSSIEKTPMIHGHYSHKHKHQFQFQKEWIEQGKFDTYYTIGIPMYDTKINWITTTWGFVIKMFDLSRIDDFIMYQGIFKVESEDRDRESWSGF